MQGMPFHELDQRIETQVFLLVKQSLQINTKYEGRTTFCWHKVEKRWKKCRTKPGQVGIRCQTKLWTLTFWTERGMLFDVATWRRSSTAAFLQNSCRRAGCKLTKLWQMYSDCTRLLPSTGLANSEFGALLAKRKIKKRELTFKHISDAWWFHRGEGFRSWSNLGFRNLAAAQNG